MKSEFYSIKNTSYYNEWREDIYNLLKGAGFFKRSLEVGCGSGILSCELKNQGIISYTVGIEPYANLIEKSNFNEFFRSDIEPLLSDLKTKEKFDLIILADMLEHTIDPWMILRNLTDCLSDNGTIVISLPNFRNIMSLYKVIIKNSFKYEKEGVFDITHMRFFCISDMKELITSADLKVIKITPSYFHKKYQFFRVNRLRIINMLTLGLFRFILADQVICICKK